MTSSVSVIIPAHNSDEWIADAVESALDQELTASEVIVVDDGSIDRTVEVVEAFGDKVKLLKSPPKGGNHARNLGWRHATSEWIQFLDSDDLLLPEKLRIHLPIAKAAGEGAVTFSQAMVTDYATGKHRYQSNPSAQAHPLEFILFELNSPIMPLYPRAALERVGGFREDLKNCQDRELHLRMWLDGIALKWFSSPLVMIRRRSGSVSAIQADCDVNYENVYRPLITHVGEMPPCAEERRYLAKLFALTSRRLVRFGDFKRGSRYHKIAVSIHPAEAELAYGRITRTLLKFAGFRAANIALFVLSKLMKYFRASESHSKES